MSTAEEWIENALCTGIDPEVFFSGGSSLLSVKARRLCLSCPVRRECLEYGWDEEYGIWGGTLPEDRFTMTQTLESDNTISRYILMAYDQQVLMKYQSKWGNWSIERLTEELLKECPPDPHERKMRRIHENAS